VLTILANDREPCAARQIARQRARLGPSPAHGSGEIIYRLALDEVLLVVGARAAAISLTGESDVLDWGLVEKRGARARESCYTAAAQLRETRTNVARHLVSMEATYRVLVG